MATDMRKPPGVTMCRNGDWAATLFIAASTSVSCAKAKPRRIAAPRPRLSFEYLVSSMPSKRPSVITILAHPTFFYHFSRGKLKQCEPEDEPACSAAGQFAGV